MYVYITYLTLLRVQCSSTKQPQTPSMLISIHSPLTRRLSSSYSYVRSPLLQVNLSMICLSYANVCWNANHIIIVLVLMLVSIHSLLLALPPSSSFSSIYSNHNSPSLIFFLPLISLSKPVPFPSQLRGYKIKQKQQQQQQQQKNK